MEVNMWAIFKATFLLLRIMDIIASEASGKKRIKINAQAARGAPDRGGGPCHDTMVNSALLMGPPNLTTPKNVGRNWRPPKNWRPCAAAHLEHA